MTEARALAADGRFAFALAGLVIVLLVGLEFARDRQQVNAAAPVGAPALLPVQGALNIPLTAGIRPDTPVITDSEAVTEALFWSRATRGRRLTVTPVLLRDSELVAGRPSIAEIPSTGLAGVDVAAWNDTPALFTMTPSGDRYGVEIQALVGGDILASRITSALPATDGERGLWMATWSGALPDLFVVDRAEDTAVRLQVLEGEAGFRRTLLERRLPVGALPAAEWLLDVGRTTGERPDLVFVSRSPQTGSGRTEVHVLTGDSTYEQWGLEQPIELAADVASSRLFGIARVSGISALLVIDPHAFTLAVERP